MGELYHGHRICHREQSNTDGIYPVSFLWDDVLDIEGSKGQILPFVTPGGKVYVRLCGNRGMWLMEQISEFRAQWVRYLNGDSDDDESTSHDPSDTSNLYPN